MPTDLSQLSGRPNLAAHQAAALLRHWRVVGTVQPLESERDQNWQVRVGGDPLYVLKVANQADSPAVIDLQQQMMGQLASAGIPCPHAVLTVTGQRWLETCHHVVWLINWRPGRRLADVTAPPDAVFVDLGAVVARSAAALAGFDHPAAHGRHLQWDMQHAGEVLAGYAHHVDAGSRRARVEQILDEYRRDVDPALRDLPRSVIHNDANDHNVLLHDDLVTGLLDFGDAVHGATVVDLAVACAYAMLNRSAPARVADLLVAGYRQHRPLPPVERTVLPALVRTRLAMSVAISAFQRTVHPDNAYLRVSEAPAWDLLDRDALRAWTVTG